MEMILKTSRTRFYSNALGVFLSALLWSIRIASGTIPMETETAMTMPKKSFEGDVAFEYQASSDGTEMAVPIALEYGLLDNVELLVEPVLYTAIIPDAGKSLRGLGDVEVTLNWRFFDEGLRAPAFALAGEAKIPTARDSLIGTGQTDYTGYIVASKTLGSISLHGNLGFTWQGSPKGVNLSNLVSFAFAIEQVTKGKWQWLAEVLANSPIGGKSLVPENPVVPEAAGGELVGTVGVRYFFMRNAALAFGASYDNSQALQMAPGLIITFH